MGGFLYEWADRPVNPPTDIGDLSPRRYFFTIAVVLGLLFAFTSNDDQEGAGLLNSLLLWQLQSCLPMTLLLAAHMGWSRFRWFERTGPWSQLLVSGVTGSLLFSPLALLIDVVLMGSDEVLSLSKVVDEFWNLWPPVTITWLAINAPFVFGLRLRGAGVSSPDDRVRGERREADSPSPGLLAPEHGPESVSFMSLIPPELRGSVIYLQAELHYLAVVTERGRSLILYNLRDAVDELSAVPGLQTHRSFWIARDQAIAVRRTGRQGVVQMCNGDEVPVSRRRLDEVLQLLESRG